MTMIKLAVVTGVIIGAGYWYIMSATMSLAMKQADNYQQQYEQAIALTEQLASSDYSTNR